MEYKDKTLAGINALVTAGPTYERIDPVRFIGNFSSGKMGIAIAEELALHGANVTLILGPSHEKVPPFVDVVNVEGSDEMYDEVQIQYPWCDIIVMAAAVADFKPAVQADQKIKKGKDEGMTIELIRTVDILSEIGKMKGHDKKTIVGFALETQDALNYAKGKKVAKNCDMIVMNQPSDTTGFATDTNKVTIITEEVEELPLMTKPETAIEIVKRIIPIWKTKEKPLNNGERNSSNGRNAGSRKKFRSSRIR